MKLKKIAYILLGALCLTTLSCDPVDENDRLIYVKPADVKRCVLLEDFTGQRCVNCPEAAKVIEQLQAEYGEEAIIAVGIHGGPLSVNGKNSAIGLGTDTGDEYYTAAGSPDLPAGRIGRVGNATTRDQWHTMVYNQIQRPTPLSITASCQYDEEARLAKIDVSTLGIEATTGKLQVWLVEDNITALQFMPDGTRNADYVHNHVFRTAVNGTWGEDFAVAEGETKNCSFTAMINDKWVAENLSAVVFVYNDGGVQQVTKAKLMAPADENKTDE